MSAEPLACPYCNALVPLPPNAREGQRVTCPRCGEAFPLRGVGDGIQIPPGVATAPLPTLSAFTLTPAPSPRTRNRLIAGAVLTVMLLMAATSLIFALRTQAERRANDTGIVRARKRSIWPEPAENSPVAPAKLPALGYLPPNTNLLAGIDVGRLRQSAASRKLLTTPIKTSKGDVDPRTFIKLWTGLELEELDHIVVGVRTEDVDFPRVVVVARTWKPIDRRRVRSTLSAEERDGPRKGELVYRFQIPNTPIRPTLWFADETTMVFDLLGSLTDVPARPAVGLDHLPFSVRDALTTRVDPGAVLWMVGAVDDWKKTAAAPWFEAVQVFTHLEKERLARLESLRVLAISVQFDPEAKAQADFRFTDATAAKTLREALIGPPEVTAELANDWLTVQWKGNLDTVFKAIGR